MKRVLSLASLALPWRIRRMVLNRFCGYKIHPTARIGFSLICPAQLEMEAGAQIGSLNVCKGLAKVKMSEHSWIGNLNWITGLSSQNRHFFKEDKQRNPQLVLGPHAAITNRHLIDCTDSVTIGSFTTFAGFRSQILTHSIDLIDSRQAARPVLIGDYCFVGTGSIVLSGSVLPSYSVLGAGSVLNKAYEETHMLYAGNPARPVKKLDAELKYFVRSIGFVN